MMRVAGRDIPEHFERLPVLANLIQDMPNVKTAFYSILDAGQRLREHRGYFKGILRYHLGMMVPEPERCALTCGDEVYHWQEGEGILFDDMFIHGAANEGTRPRVVLFIDVETQVAVWTEYPQPLDEQISRSAPCAETTRQNGASGRGTCHSRAHAS